MRRKIRRAFILLFLAGTIVFGTLTGKLLLDYRRVDAVYDGMAEEYVTAAAPVQTVTPVPEAETVNLNDPEWDEYAPIMVNLTGLQSENPDCKGWLYCEETQINYPVMQGETNDTYIHSLFDKSYNIAGSVFMDYRAKSDFSDLRTVLYGHNMINGSMFGTLDSYTDPDYASAHDRLYLLTPAQNYRLEVIGAKYVHVSDPLYMTAQTDGELQDFIEGIREDSLLPPMHEETAYNKVCCLSTCAYVFDGARLVLVCGMVPIG